MKWFQLDSNAPDDPKIRSLIKRMGNAGFGGLVRLWCYVAQHGTKRPGWAVDSRGRPFEKEILKDKSGLNSDEFELLLSEIVRSGHCKVTKRGVLVFPAMYTRTDTYTRRKFEHSSKNVPVQDNTRQDKTDLKYSGASAPRGKPARKNGQDPYRTVLKLTHQVLGRIPLKDTVEFVSVKEDVKQLCSKYGIPSEGDVVGRAVESALAVRAKVGEKR